MSVAYVDSSMILGIVFQETGYRRWVSEILESGHVFSANLLEAEVRAAVIREGVTEASWHDLLGRINWIHPNRPLSGEFEAVLAAGYLRGADLWHLACALFLREYYEDVGFLSLDRRQLGVADQLGLRLL